MFEGSVIGESKGGKVYEGCVIQESREKVYEGNAVWESTRVGNA